VLGVSVVSPVQASPATEVQALLEKMADGLRMQDYRGRLIYEQHSEMSSMEVVHLVRDGKEFERILFLDGEQKEIIREGKPVDCYQPGELILRGAVPQNLADRVGQLYDNYEILIDGEERIAGRQAVVLKIKPRDQFRFGYTLAIDRESGLLLHSSLMSENGKILEQFRFVSVQLDSVADHDLQPVTKNFNKLPAGDCVKPEHFSMEHSAPWVFSAPAGYAFCVYEKPHTMDSNAMVYSDGLSTFSVFVKQGKEMVDTYRQGSTLMHSENIQFDGHQYTVTVVGEIPERAARMVTGSIKPR
jgi:sigma-E factor negative regulatory protein RseB